MARTRGGLHGAFAHNSSIQQQQQQQQHEQHQQQQQQPSSHSIAGPSQPLPPPLPVAGPSHASPSQPIAGSSRQAMSLVRRNPLVHPPGGKAPRKGGYMGQSGKRGPGDGAPPIKPARWPSGTVAMREIKRLQKLTTPLLLKAPFSRLVREIAHVYNNQLRFEKVAIEALQEGAEAHIVRLYEDTNMAAVHAKRITIRPEDIAVAIRICGDFHNVPPHLRGSLRS